MLLFTRDDFPDSDFTLHTGDGIDLHVHRSILSTSSEFFRDMLSLPQPSPSGSGDSNTVAIPEDAEIMRALLWIIYPVASSPRGPNAWLRMAQPPPSVPVLISRLEIAVKYSFDLATEIISEQLAVRIRLDPRTALPVYAAASTLGLKQLTQEASRECLKLSLVELCTAYYDPRFEPQFLVESPVSAGSPSIHPQTISTRRGSFSEQQTKPTVTDEEKILRRASAWDYHRLMALYIGRLRKVKSLLAEGGEGAWFGTRSPRGDENDCSGYDCDQRCWRDFLNRARVELETSGPDAQKIFTKDFLIDSFSNNTSTCRCGWKLLTHYKGNLERLKISVASLEDCVD